MNVQLEVFQPEHWYNAQEVRQMLVTFYKEKARCLYHPRKEASEELNLYLNKLEAEMKKEGLWDRLQHSGSTEEDLKVNDGLEFDVMCIINGKNIDITNVEDYPGFAHLSIKEGTKGNKENILQRSVDSKCNYLSPIKFMKEYFREIETAVEKTEELGLKTQIKMKEHGPAVCLIFEHSSGFRKFKVDIVPTIEIKKEGVRYQYVAKPVCYTKKAYQLRNSWRQSTSNKEIEAMKNIDRGKECRKKCIRTVKAICKNDATLRTLSSFHLKMIFLNAFDQDLPITWDPDDFHERIFDVLNFIEQYLEAETLPHYFIKEMNIFRTSHFSSKHIPNMLDRIRNLLTDDEKFIDAITYELND